MIDLDNLPTEWITTPDKSRALTLDEMQNNAAMFTLYFARDLDAAVTLEWTPEAVAGILGNITAESTINPSRWQNDTKPAEDVTDTGYGLVQWTPYTKYSEWAKDYESIWGPWENNGMLETERIAYERKHDLQWIATDKFNFGFKDFTLMRESPEYMAEAFLYDYERPENPAASVESRKTWAKYWYDNVVLPIYGGGESSLLIFYLHNYIFNCHDIRRFL